MCKQFSHTTSTNRLSDLESGEARGQVVFDVSVGALNQPQGQMVEVFECVCLHHTEVAGSIQRCRLARQLQEEPAKQSKSQQDTQNISFHS